MLGPNCITFCRHMCRRPFDLHYRCGEERLISHSERDYSVYVHSVWKLSGIEVKAVDPPAITRYVNKVQTPSKSETD